jgi:hypothetical protein
MALSARVNLVEATTFIDLVIFSMFLTDFNLVFEMTGRQIVASETGQGTD